METMHADVQVKRVNDNMYTVHGLGLSIVLFSWAILNQS